MFKSTLVLLVSLLPVCANAGILWQQTPSDGTTGYVNQEFSDFAAFSTYAVNDVTVGAGGWQINAITEPFTANNWPSSFSVILNIFAKSGALPVAGNDPTTGTTYAATLSRSGNIDTVTVSGLNISLSAGDYWIGFSPVLGFGASGQEFQLISSTTGSFSGFRNPGNGFSWGTAWMTSTNLGNSTSNDLAIEIDGTVGGAAVPEPGAMTLLGSAAAALLALRRRAIRK
jgi:hypothetical protein